MNKENIDNPEQTTYNESSATILQKDQIIIDLIQQVTKYKLATEKNAECIYQQTEQLEKVTALLKEIAMSNMTKEQIKKKAKEFLWPGSVVYKH